MLDKPLIQHAVDEAAAAGMEQVIIVTSPGKPALERYFEGASSFLPNILFVTQKEPLGLGHAVLMAADAVGNEPFLVMLPDDLIFHQQSGTEQVLDVYRRYGESVIAVERVPLDEVGRYGIIDGEQTEDHVFQIRGLVEKPDPEHAPSNLAIVGRYIMPPDIFSCLRQTTPGAIGEIQLTDAVSLLLKERPVYARELLGVRHDGGSPLGLLKASVEGSHGAGGVETGHAKIPGAIPIYHPKLGLSVAVH